MEMGNRYGINLGAIYSTANAIKNARIARKLKEREMEKEDAIVTGKVNALTGAGGSDAPTQTSTDVTDTKQMPKSDKPKENGFVVAESVSGGKSKGLGGDNELTRSQKISMLAEDDMKQKLLQRELIKKQHEARKQMYIAQNFSERDADLRATLDVNEVAKLQDMFQKADEFQRKNIKQNINDAGNFMAYLIEMEDKPAEADKLFRNRREQRLQMVNELRKKGRNKEADEIEERLNAMPQSILKPDGTLNKEFLTNELTKLTYMARTTEENVQIRKDNRTNNNAIKLAQEQAKLKAPKVVTEGSEDILYEPDSKTGKYREVSRGKSNNILKELAKAKTKGSGSGANDRGMIKFINSSIKNYFPYDVVKGADGEITYNFKDERDAELADRIRKVAIEKWEKDGKPLNYAPYVTQAIAEVAPDKAPKTSRKMGTAKVKEGARGVVNRNGKKIPVTFNGKEWVDPQGNVIK